MSPTNPTTNTTPPYTGSAASSGSSSSGASSGASSATDPLANETTFLKLLVSQLQNQDPLNPMDSTTFVSQLTSYSQLEQLINIDKNTAPAAASAAASTGATGTGTTGTGTTGNGTTPPSSGTTPPSTPAAAGTTNSTK